RPEFALGFQIQRGLGIKVRFRGPASGADNGESNK
ncbi:unnamed protein product, partial [marine sediment metagenome]